MKKFGTIVYNGTTNNKTLKDNLLYLKSIGFDEISEGLDYKTYPLEELYKVAKELNMKISSFHSRYKNQDISSLWKNNSDTAKYIISLKEDISLCSKFEVPYLVIHIGNKNTTEITNVLIKNIKELLKFAIKRNVILCVENIDVFRYDDVKALIAKIKSPYLKMCLDIGHFNIFEDNKDFKRIYNDDSFINNIVYLHLHGNHGEKDEHLPLQYSNYNILLLRELFNKIPNVSLTSETFHTYFDIITFEEQALEVMKGLKLLQ